MKHVSLILAERDYIGVQQIITVILFITEQKELNFIVFILKSSWKKKEENILPIIKLKSQLKL